MNNIADEIINNAKKLLGCPYVWGGESMDEGGYDCSGMVYYALKNSGIKVSRLKAAGYYKKFKDNKCDKNVKGALLFFGKNKSNITHVAISLGNNQMIESRGTSANTKNNKGLGVVISKITRRADFVYAATPFDYVPAAPKLAMYTLKQGCKGFEVNYLQEDLNYVMNSKLVVDGIFGAKTKAALKEFQASHQLVVDGIYGKKSYTAMKGELY